ncbi:MAG: HlyC/CorC family transporter [Candidatus Diapherotrites archaeon]|jgi:putative hemolysin|nr:HlyC/CorC family transporter [Candidatus Diapherotrites archaeon]MBT4596917.1 HlyC/CorC family transporter [Candidatus Diapherotrites archaeon]
MIEEILVLVILLALSAFFSASETAFYSADRFKVEKLVKNKVKGAKKLQQLKENQNKLLITILVMNNVVNIGAASLAAVVVLELFPGNLAVALSTFIMTILVLIFGEITPKSYATKHSVQMALSISGPMSVLVTILTPITWFLDKLTHVLVGAQSKEALTEEEVKMVVSLGHEEGAIDEEEKEIIQNVFRLDDVSVEEVMTPRVEMIAIEKKQTLKQLKKFLKETPYSKIPVYDGDEDNIVGIFSVRKALDYIGRKLDVKISSLLDEPFFVPRSKKIGDLLREFQEKKVHIAIVVGDHGGVLGVITLEDILEELVGEITEEKDTGHEVKKINKKTIVVEGATELDLINDELDTEIESEKFNTVAGFLLEKLDRVPQKGEKFKFDKIKFEVLKAKKNKIEKVKITK